MPDATIAHVIAGTVHNDHVSGARIAISHKRGGRAVVIVYGPDGKRVRTMLYRRLERAEITHGEVGDE